VELPIECDDEYWENDDPAKAFKQPAGKPSLTTYFNCSIRLNNILASSLKMLVRLLSPFHLFPPISVFEPDVGLRVCDYIFDIYRLLWITTY
jgi:hypothetical protein